MLAPPLVGVGALRRELDYFRRENSQLGSLVFRLTEEQQIAFVESQRSRVLVQLTRDLNRLVLEAQSVEALSDRMLATIVDTTHCAGAAFFFKDQNTPDGFHGVAQAGLLPPIGSRAQQLRLINAPTFLFTNDAGSEGGAAASLAQFIEMPHVLWSWDTESGYALVLGNRVAKNISGPFSEADRNLVEIALSIFLIGLSRYSVGQAAGSATAGLNNEGLVAGGSPSKAEDEIPGIDMDEIRQGLKVGGHITGLTIVERPDNGRTTHVPYVMVSWGTGWRVQTAVRDGTDRVYIDVRLLLRTYRGEFRYGGGIATFTAGSASLEAFPAIAQREKSLDGAKSSRKRSSRSLKKADDVVDGAHPPD